MSEFPVVSRHSGICTETGYFGELGDFISLALVCCVGLRILESHLVPCTKDV